MRKTKIVCTLGPKTSSVEAIKELIKAGMNAARFNFSHSNYEEHKALLDNLIIARNELGVPVASILDTKGPEIRLGEIDGIAHLEKGSHFVLVIEDIIGNSERATITYKELYRNLNIGDIILLNDGLIKLEVMLIENTNIHCAIKNSGELTSHKSINMPNVKINLPSLTEKDINDINFAIDNNFDFIAASFVRKTDDIIAIKNILKGRNAEHIRIIAKIENSDGVKNIDEILQVTNCIMVARGDLGVEIPMEQVPIIQKDLIKKSYKAGKPVITATQMLESMIHNPTPTRAEVSDVANAVYDSTSAVMLSAESAIGDYANECVTTMDKISTEVESIINYWSRFTEREEEIKNNDKIVINYASCLTAMHMNANALIAFTLSGGTARLLSRFRPNIPIIAITPNEIVYRQLALSWGVIPIHIPNIYTIDEATEVGINKCIETGILNKGDIVVISGGYNDNTAPDGENGYRLNRVLGGILRI